MSKCPFWSTTSERVSCYNDCPMNPIVSEEEACPFKECASMGKINFKDIIDDNFAYSQDKIFEFDAIAEL